MIRIKAKTPTPTPRAPKPRIGAAKANTVAARLAALDDLVERAERSGGLAEALAAAVCGEQSKEARLAPLAADPNGLVGALAARAVRFAQALDRCDVALTRAFAALG